MRCYWGACPCKQRFLCVHPCLCMCVLCVRTTLRVYLCRCLRVCLYLPVPVSLRVSACSVVRCRPAIYVVSRRTAERPWPAACAGTGACRAAGSSAMRKRGNWFVSSCRRNASARSRLQWLLLRQKWRPGANVTQPRNRPSIVGPSNRPPVLTKVVFPPNT